MSDNLMQDTIKRAVEEEISGKLAEWFYNTYEDTALELGLAKQRGTLWEELPEDHVVRRLLTLTCIKFLRADFMEYTDNTTVVYGGIATFEEPIVFQGNKDANSDS